MIKEQKTRLNLHENDDDDNYDKSDLFTEFPLLKSIISMFLNAYNQIFVLKVSISQFILPPPGFCRTTCNSSFPASYVPRNDNPN